MDQPPQPPFPGRIPAGAWMAAVLLAQASVNAAWFHFDGLSMFGCQSVWIETQALDFARSLQDAAAGGPLAALGALISRFSLSHNSWCPDPTAFSPTTALLSLAAAACRDPSGLLALAALLLFLPYALVVWATYRLGARLYGPLTGLRAGLIASCLPGLAGLSRKTNPEMMTALAVLGLLHLMAGWDRLGRKAWAAAAAAVFCAGVLSGPLFWAFGPPLLLVHVLRAVGTDPRPHLRAGAACAAVAAAGLFVAAYCGGHPGLVLEQVRAFLSESRDKLLFRSDSFIGSAKQGLIESFLAAPQDSVCPCTQSTDVGLTLKTFSFYLLELCYYLSPAWFVAAAVSAGRLAMHRGLGRRAFWTGAGAGLAAAYLLLSASYIKWGKFAAPFLPALALAIAAGFPFPRRRPAAASLLLAAAGFGILLYHSFAAAPGMHFNETLCEGMIAHRPVPATLLPASRSLGAALRADPALDPVVFLDRESLRFAGDWINDRSARLACLVRVFAGRPVRLSLFWSDGPELAAALAKARGLLLLTGKPEPDPVFYLFGPAPAPDHPGLESLASAPAQTPPGTHTLTLLKIAPVPKEHRSPGAVGS